MKLILKQNVPNLGYKDDIVEVKDGYGRNYLIPQGMAIIATKASIKQLEEDLKQRAHKIAKILADAREEAAKIEGVKLVIPAKVSATGTVFGSVGPAQISEALTKLGHEIDRKIISVKDPVKVVGNYIALVRFHKDVAVELEFEVIPEETEE